MGVCASDRREPGGSSASIPGTAFFRDEIRMMIRRENDGKPSREKGQGHGGSSGAGSDGGEDFGLPKSEIARNELSRELNMHFSSPAVLGRMWTAYAQSAPGMPLHEQAMTLEEVWTLTADVLVRFHQHWQFKFAGFFVCFCCSMCLIRLILHTTHKHEK